MPPFNLGKYYHDHGFMVLLVSVLVILSIGTLFYHTVEGWRYIDSLYFSVTTLATVGFGDFHPATDLGKAFTVIYIIVGIGELLSFINVFTAKRKEPVRAINSMVECGPYNQ